METDLEIVINKKIKPIIKEFGEKVIGTDINELNLDISDKLEKNPLLSFAVSTSLNFKSAKKVFRKQYLTRLLQLFYGNISKVGQVSGLDRRTIHRYIEELSIDVEKIREEMIRNQEYKKEAVSSVLKDTISEYESMIDSTKIKKVYDQVPELSEGIAKELPITTMSWKEAEQEFEKDYLIKALNDNSWDEKKTAKKIKVSYETIHRKIKQLGLK
jgi:DNA-binding NtrC family response regulator